MGGWLGSSAIFGRILLPGAEEELPLKAVVAQPGPFCEGVWGAGVEHSPEGLLLSSLCVVDGLLDVYRVWTGKLADMPHTFEFPDLSLLIIESSHEIWGSLTVVDVDRDILGQVSRPD